MKADLDRMIACNHLEDRITLVGPVRHEDVCQHLVQGTVPIGWRDIRCVYVCPVPYLELPACIVPSLQ